MSTGIVAKIRTLIEGDPTINRVANDPTLTAELMLLFRVMLADGKVEQSEMDMLRNICNEAFDIGPDSFDKVFDHINEFGYETTGMQAASLFVHMPIERKRSLIDRMGAIASADHELDEREIAMIKRTVALLNGEIELT